MAINICCSKFAGCCDSKSSTEYRFILVVADILLKRLLNNILIRHLTEKDTIMQALKQKEDQFSGSASDSQHNTSRKKRCNSWYVVIRRVAIKKSLL